DCVVVVSPIWRGRRADEYGVEADVVTNGVDVDRFTADPPPGAIAALRTRAGAAGRFLVLTVGGIKPPKGTDPLFRALAPLRRRWDRPPVLAIIGGHSFQDHTPYRDRVIASMADLDLQFGRDGALRGRGPRRHS